MADFQRSQRKKDAAKNGGLSHTRRKTNPKMADFPLNRKERLSQQWGTWQPKTKPEMYLRCALTRKKDAANMADFRYARDTTTNYIDL